VFDLQAGKWMHSIPGFKKPQGALFVPEFNKLFVASGDDGMLRVFKGDTFELIDSIHLEPGPNRVVYQPDSKLVYVGYGGKDAGKDYGEVGIIDARNDKPVGDIKVVAHPSELLLNKSGTTLFVFISIANRLQVIDTNQRQVVSTWPVTSDHPGDAAFDESTSRLFIGLPWTRSRARKSLIFPPPRAWTASTLTQHASEYTFPEDETYRLVLPTSINRKMLTTTRPLARFPPAEAPAHPSGRPS
jgi:hypothetical protein